MRKQLIPTHAQHRHRCFELVRSISGKTSRTLEFTSDDDDPDELPLTFDPVGKTLTVPQGTTKFFEGEFSPTTGDGNGTPGPEPESELEEFMTSTGLDADAKARARYRVTDKVLHRFDVEIEDVPVGNYSLIVAGTSRGTIRVASTPEGIEGEIEFDSKVEPGSRPLNFDPRGQLIEITGAGQTHFSHILGSGSSTGGGGPVVPFEVEVPLINSGADANASAKTELKRKVDGELSVEVEVEDLDAGPTNSRSATPSGAP